MRKGFTLIEMMIALSISAVILTAIGGLLTSVWMLAKESSDEVQCMLHACALRNRLMHKLKYPDGEEATIGGLLNATNLQVFALGPRIIHAEGDYGDWFADLAKSDDRKYYCIDESRCSSGRNGLPIQHLFLAIPGNKSTYLDRLIVPIYGMSLNYGDFKDAIGGKEWSKR